jgi:dihydroxyacetone kinase-like predicted kinase
MLSMDLSSQSEDEMRENALEAIKSVHTALITLAARDSDFDGHAIRAGEYLGLLDGALLGSDADINALIGLLAERLSAFSPEFLTVYYGEDVGAETAQAAGSALAAKHPSAEMSVINGGQPIYHYMIAAE